MIDLGEVVQAVGALAAVIGLVVGSGVLLRRLERSRFGAGSASARLEIVTQRALDPKTRLVLVRLRFDGAPRGGRSGRLHRPFQRDDGRVADGSTAVAAA